MGCILQRVSADSLALVFNEYAKQKLQVMEIQEPKVQVNQVWLKDGFYNFYSMFWFLAYNIANDYVLHS